jgi:hypothetical protein
LCDIAAPAKELFESLELQVVKAIKEPLGSINVQINIDKVTDPLISKVEATLKNFTNEVGESLSTGGCNRRFLQGPEDPTVLTTSENPSLSSRIRKAIAEVNAILAKAGIALSADVSPYFDKETFSVGVEVKLNAQIRQSAENIVGLVSDFFNDVSNPPKQDPNLSKLGGNTSSSSLVAIDVNDLLQDTGKLSY